MKSINILSLLALCAPMTFAVHAHAQDLGPEGSIQVAQLFDFGGRYGDDDYRDRDRRDRDRYRSRRSRGCGGFDLFRPDCWGGSRDSDWGGDNFGSKLDPNDPRYRSEYVAKIETRPISENSSQPTTSGADIDNLANLKDAYNTAAKKRDAAAMRSLQDQMNTPAMRAAQKPNAWVKFNYDDLKNPNDWKVKYFDVIVVINKSPRGQYLQAWRRLKNSNGLPEPVTFTQTVRQKNGQVTQVTTTRPRVSTGRERPELSNVRKEACARDWRCQETAERMGLSLEEAAHTTLTSYFSQTTPGYYTPTWLNIGHVSGQYESSAMDHAVFFNGGIAMHRVPHGSENRLGSRASGACVRLNAGYAKEIFWLVRATGGPFKPNELRQGMAFWTDVGEPSNKSKREARKINQIWACANTLGSDTSYDDDDDWGDRRQSSNSTWCRQSLESFLPPRLKNCDDPNTAQKNGGKENCELANGAKRAQFGPLYDALPAVCYVSDAVLRDRNKQLKCLATERSRILNKSVPIFSQELDGFKAANNGQIPPQYQPYGDQTIMVPKFDRLTGQPVYDQNRQLVMVPSDYKTLVVVENADPH